MNLGTDADGSCAQIWIRVAKSSYNQQSQNEIGDDNGRSFHVKLKVVIPVESRELRR